MSKATSSSHHTKATKPEMSQASRHAGFFQLPPKPPLIIFALIFAIMGGYIIWRSHAAPAGFPHVSGTQIVDDSGNPLTIHSAQLEGVLNAGMGGAPVTNYSTIVATMAAWHFNAIRLPSCSTYWQSDPTGYMAKIQNAVQTATAAGLYVILDLHDDHNCSPPYPWPGPYHLPRPGMDSYWRAVATTYKDNPKIIFDSYNEPSIQATPKEQYTTADWQLWRNGGTVQDSNGTETFIGIQQLVDAIRGTGAQQIIMVEGYSTAETFHNIGTNTVSDPLNNTVYEAHTYDVQAGSTQWDTDFGFMAANFPVFVGEWSLMGGDNSGNTNCGGITSPAQADQVVSTFLTYMAGKHMSWSAYSFNPEHLVVDYTNYAPTTFFSGWQCPARGTDTHNNAGMGKDVKNYLASFTTTVVGDCNNDGHVNITDLSLLLSHYGTAYSACDFNGDGVVDIFDMSALLSHYGT